MNKARGREIFIDEALVCEIRRTLIIEKKLIIVTVGKILNPIRMGYKCWKRGIYRITLMWLS